MESQNHYYGHSGAFARYLGLRRPRHIRGLVQHGWTASSPVQTHFRDFPTIGLPGGRRDRSLFVWSHASRAWDAAAETRTTVPIGAPWLYLTAAAGVPASGPEAAGTVILPFHGIPTQRVQGDHAATARQWALSEGPATVCLYHVEAEDPAVVAAYSDAGHRCVTLGTRTDGQFLARLLHLLGTAERVVSNRLSTPIVYAAALGRPVAVHGDTMRLDGEDDEVTTRLRSLWPEFHDDTSTTDELRAIALRELGQDHFRSPEDLRHLLGWDRPVRSGPWVDHWVAAPVSRALTNVRRRSSTAAPSGTPGPEATTGLSASAWLRGALSYLPRPLGVVGDPRLPRPLTVPHP